jgi:hypothetical protein
MGVGAAWTARVGLGAVAVSWPQPAKTMAKIMQRRFIPIVIRPTGRIVLVNRQT